jgi:hypothetical protein
MVDITNPINHYLDEEHEFPRGVGRSHDPFRVQTPLEPLHYIALNSSALQWPHPLGRSSPGLFFLEALSMTPLLRLSPGFGRPCEQEDWLAAVLPSGSLLRDPGL